LWLEYVLEGAQLAKERGLYTNVVTNGLMTPQALDLIGPHLDAYRVDIKGFSQQTYRRMANLEDFTSILEVARRARHRWQMHVEVVTNVTPGYNDDKQQLAAIANWVCQELGPDIPWHVTRFYPHRELQAVLPTPVATLERARQIGLDAGLRYVYLGNVPGHPGENTYCPSCGELLIERSGHQIMLWALRNGRCPRCSQKIPIVGQHIQGAGISLQTH
jgi:pyruvate formate lyase activating enzyme